MAPIVNLQRTSSTSFKPLHCGILDSVVELNDVWPAQCVTRERYTALPFTQTPAHLWWGFDITSGRASETKLTPTLRPLHFTYGEVGKRRCKWGLSYHQLLNRMTVLYMACNYTVKYLWNNALCKRYVTHYLLCLEAYLFTVSVSAAVVFFSEALQCRFLGSF